MPIHEIQSVTLPSSAVDNHGHAYTVTIETGDPHFGPVLHVKNTPGRWFLKTLLDGRPRARIAIDCGQHWIVDNFDAVMAEAMQAVAANPWIAVALSKAAA
ncbi:MAG: hypothetical protein RIT24_1239 [Planctomycetota bacterium]|jgi:hypothetical protein